MIFQIITNYKDLLLEALGKTMSMALLALLFGSVIGLIIGTLNTLRSKTAQFIATFYVDVVRGWPLIVLAFFVYFGLPMFVRDLFNPDFRLTAWEAGVVALALNSGAYMAEIIRGGILSVDKGQMEAARSLGMSYPSAMWKIVVPQAIRTMIPSIINQFIITFKDTSILTVIGVPELTNAAKTISANTMRPFETWFVTGMMYMIVILFLSKISKITERKFSNGR